MSILCPAFLMRCFSILFKEVHFHRAYFLPSQLKASIIRFKANLPNYLDKRLMLLINRILDQRFKVIKILAKDVARAQHQNLSTQNYKPAYFLKNTLYLILFCIIKKKSTYSTEFWKSKNAHLLFDLISQNSSKPK